jgi:hypothetical protein
MRAAAPRYYATQRKCASSLRTPIFRARRNASERRETCRSEQQQDPSHWAHDFQPPPRHFERNHRKPRSDRPRDHRSGDDFRAFAPPGLAAEHRHQRKHDRHILRTGGWNHEEAKGYKYCIICGTLKPLELFDKHAARKTGRQGECNLCKQLYNSMKNQTRIADPHREASQKRRLYTELTNSPRIDIGAI